MKIYTHNTTLISVIDAKFHKNPLLRLLYFQFFQTAVTNLSYRYDFLPCWRYLLLLHLLAGECPSPPCPWDSCTAVSWDTRLHQPTGLATEQSRSQSGGLCDLGHSAGTSLPLPDPWRRPSERTTDWRVASFWSQHYWQSSELVAWSTT